MENKNITTIILTFNEELNIQKCIDSVKEISQKIIVIDSFSTDKTEEICLENNVEFIKRKFESYSDQFNYILNNITIKTPWILRLDADEYLTKEGSVELRNICKDNLFNKSINGVILKFNVFFMGTEIKYGGISPIKNLRVIRNGFGGIESRIMDEHLYISSGDVLTMKNITIHNDKKNIHSFISKHNKYSDYETIEYLNSLKIDNEKILGKEARKKRVLKNYGYYKLPSFLRCFLYFFYRYVYKLGFLDGKEGFIFHFLQAFWYRMLVDIKIFEYKKVEK